MRGQRARGNLAARRCLPALAAACAMATATAAEATTDAKAGEFIEAHVKRVKPLEYEAAIAWWKANTTGKDEDFALKEKAQNKLDAVLANVAERNGATCLSLVDEEQNPVTGKDPSEWLVMAQHSPAFDSLAKDPRWRMVEGRKGSPAWTDDFSNILRVFRWY